MSDHRDLLPASRREALTVGGVAVALVGSAVGGSARFRQRRAHLPLHSQTVAYASDQLRILVADPDLIERDTRVAAGPGTSEPLRRMNAFLATARPWLARAPERHRELAESALLDLWVLTDQLPAAVAGWSPRWQYVWPRDASFVAAALGRVGHLPLAVRQLRYLQHVQGVDGWFEARYVPATGLPPDGRLRQFDGTGLALWALRDVCNSAVQQGLPVPSGLDALLGRSARALLRATDNGASLPTPSPDFWEVPERRCTIGLAACTLSGLAAAGPLLGADDAAARLRTVLASTYAGDGFQRYGTTGGPDAGAAFLDATGVAGLTTPVALRSTHRALRRRAGGIAPGASWKDDGISWTPATSLLGLALARAGERDRADGVLDWLAEHRTDLGSIPEKVLHDGSPAAEAPLSWAAANVILTLDELSRPLS